MIKSFLSKKYPFPDSKHWIGDCAFYCGIVFLILYFLQPFGFSYYSGNKILASALFTVVAFLCCIAFNFCVSIPLHKHVRHWKIWHEITDILAMILCMGIANFFLASFLFHYPLSADSSGILFQFIYWTLIIGAIISSVSVTLRYQRYLRDSLDSMLEKTTEEQVNVKITISDTRLRGSDLTIFVNDLLYIEAQKNDVAVYYIENGEMQREEVHTTLAAVLKELKDYDNIFQTHRSFIVNMNNITKAKGNSNGYFLTMGDDMAIVPVSRSYVPKRRSFIA